MNILGIHDGHNASAALVINGVLKCAISEERYSRQKHHYGFPKEAVKAVLDNNKISINQIDFVAFSSKMMPPRYFYTRRNSTFSIKDSPLNLS